MKFLIPVVMLIAVVLGWKADTVRSIVNPPVRDGALDVHENSAAASLVGQVRTTASSWLWLKADGYLHNGVDMRPLSEAEEARGRTVEEAAADGNEKLHKENEVTVVPPQDRDFRGFFGDVERQVASWKDMHGHSHNDPEVAMPLYRLMTWLDPQFVQGWTMGGMILARDRTPAGTRLAVDFLTEGWRANPSSVELPSQIGMTIASRRRDLKQAIDYLEQARELGYPRRKELGENDLEGLRSAYRWLVMCYRNLGDRSQESKVMIEAIHVFPDDKLFPRWRRQEPGDWEQTGNRAREAGSPSYK